MSQIEVREQVEVTRKAFERCARHAVSCLYVKGRGPCDCGVAIGYAALNALRKLLDWRRKS